jgi:predicted ATPase
MLDHIGSDAPVVLALEDLHRADPSTLDLVRHLGQARPEGRRLLLVCTYRSTGIEQDAPLLWQLLGSASFFRRTERVELTRFGLEEMRALVNGASGEQVDPRLVRRCYEWSSGNPFFAEQLLAAGALAGLRADRSAAGHRSHPRLAADTGRGDTYGRHPDHRHGVRLAGPR